MKIKNIGEDWTGKFVEKLIKDKGELQDETEISTEKERIIDEVTKEMVDRMIKELPDDRLSVLYKKIEGGEEISQNLLNSVVLGAGLDYEKIVGEVFKAYRGKYLGKEVK